MSTTGERIRSATIYDYDDPTLEESTGLDQKVMGELLRRGLVTTEKVIQVRPAEGADLDLIHDLIGWGEDS